MSSQHAIIQIRPSSGGLRRYAVVSESPDVRSEWDSNRDIPCQSDQSWAVEVWRRIEGRGYVVRLTGSGQWGNRGDHGVYLGVAPTAEAACLAAWHESSGWDDYRDEIHEALVAPCRDHDSEVSPPAVE